MRRHERTVRITADRPDALGDWATAIRLTRGLDQQEVGHRMAVQGAAPYMNQGRICELETDKTKVWTREDLALWCRVLSVERLLPILWRLNMERSQALAGDGQPLLLQEA